MPNELDLHGVRHSDVQRKLDQFLNVQLSNGTNEVRIVTGFSNKMKEVVDGVLEDYGLVSKYSFLSDATLIVKL